ncbi:MAG: hypothetical protein KDD82_07250 [Planctomycetes bacterium]|nr:hypothetical protein [Planctomycetota bacterium]
MKLERLLLAGLLCAPALAAPDVADLAGTWKRINSKDKSETVLRLELDGDALVSTLEGLEDGLECTGRFTLKGDVLRGKVRWVDTKYGTDSTVPWKFTFKSDDAARGSCGWLDTSYEPFKRGYTIYFLERMEDTGPSDAGDTGDSGDSSSDGGREGWITSDGGEEPYGDAVSAAELVGGWKGPEGAWRVSADGERLTLEPVGHSSGVSLELEDDRGVFRGEVSYAGGTSRVELALDGERLVGRSSWTEGGEEGWAPLSFERLQRLDAGEPAGEDGVEPGSDAELAGAYRRDDGLYLRLGADGEGELVAKDGALSCRVRLQSEGGVWTGTANWDGVETRWELARTDEGLVGRCQWVDVHEGQVVARGWSARSFERLKRAF